MRGGKCISVATVCSRHCSPPVRVGCELPNTTRKKEEEEENPSFFGSGGEGGTKRIDRYRDGRGRSSRKTLFLLFYLRNCGLYPTSRGKCNKIVSLKSGSKIEGEITSFPENVFS